MMATAAGWAQTREAVEGGAASVFRLPANVTGPRHVSSVLLHVRALARGLQSSVKSIDGLQFTALERALE